MTVRIRAPILLVFLLKALVFSVNRRKPGEEEDY